MEDIFMGLLLIALVAGIYFGVKRKWRELGISVVVLIISFVGFNMTYEETEAEVEEPETEDVVEVEEKEVEVEKEEEKQKSEEDLIGEFDEVGEMAFGDGYVKTSVLWDIEKAVYHDDGSYNPDESIIDVINVEAFLSSSQIRSFLMSSTDLLEDFQDVNFNRIHVSGDGKFTDQYGKETDQNATYLEITKETIDKINFDNFNWKNLPDVADNFWMHQSMDTKGLD